MTVDHFEALFNSKYLRWFDIVEKGDVTVTIEKIERAVEMTLPGGVKDRKPVMHFVNASKPLVLNKTNGELIAELHGSEVSKWIGKKITLYVDKNVRCKGKIKPGIRVRVPEK